MKYTSLFACLIGAVWGATYSNVSLCVDDSSSSFSITGTYTWYDNYILTSGTKNMSIWIQDTDGEAYIIFFDDSLGNTYEAWGLYKCDLASYYSDYADEGSDKSPATKDGCQGDPVVFCPALDDDDANSLGDGQSPSDGSLDYDSDSFPHFFNCSNWFAYENDMSYPSAEIVTWVLGDSCDDDTDTESSDEVVAPGEKTNNGSDSESASKMSSGAKAVLWIILSVFIVACIAAACYFGYHWHQKHTAELRQSMAEDGGDAVVAPATSQDDGNTLETGV